MFDISSIVYFQLGGGCLGSRPDSAAFLYSLVNKYGSQPVKLYQTGKHEGQALDICYNWGPRFGGGPDLFIASYASTQPKSFSNLGHTYSLPTGYNFIHGNYPAASFLAGTKYFQPDEVEVFYETTWRNRGVWSLSFAHPAQ